MGNHVTMEPDNTRLPRRPGLYQCSTCFGQTMQRALAASAMCPACQHPSIFHAGACLIPRCKCGI